MKRIVIFCDDTWNRSDAVSPTNVVQLAQAVKPTAADRAKLISIYLQGVDAACWTRFRKRVPPLRCLDHRFFRCDPLGVAEVREVCVR